METRIRSPRGDLHNYLAGERSRSTRSSPSVFAYESAQISGMPSNEMSEARGCNDIGHIHNIPQHQGFVAVLGACACQVGVPSSGGSPLPDRGKKRKERIPEGIPENEPLRWITRNASSSRRHRTAPKGCEWRALGIPQGNLTCATNGSMYIIQGEVDSKAAWWRLCPCRVKLTPILPCLNLKR